MGLDYIQLAPHFVREVLEIYEAWNGKDQPAKEDPRTHDGP